LGIMTIMLCHPLSWVCSSTGSMSKACAAPVRTANGAELWDFGWLGSYAGEMSLRYFVNAGTVGGGPGLRLTTVRNDALRPFVMTGLATSPGASA
jgi:hypothetical protein